MKATAATMMALVTLVMMLSDEAFAMTVGLDEAAHLPAELQPIVAGGSWFDDMAIKKLQKKKDLHPLEDLDSHDHEPDSEEMFIIRRLKGHRDDMMPGSIRIGSPVEPDTTKQNTREAMRSFLRQQTQKQRQRDHHQHHHSDEEDDDGDITVTASKEFMKTYEKALENFFKNFMSAMLQAEIGGVSIENRSEEEHANTVVEP